jgi:Phage-related protein
MMLCGLARHLLQRPPEEIARVFYCTVIDRRIVILHQFVKKSEKTPLKELEIARRRVKEVT